MNVKLKLIKTLPGEARDQVFFKVSRIPESHVLQTWEFDESKLMLNGALLRAVQMTGALERILELTVSYSKSEFNLDGRLDNFKQFSIKLQF